VPQIVTGRYLCPVLEGSHESIMNELVSYLFARLRLTWPGGRRLAPGGRVRAAVLDHRDGKLQVVEDWPEPAAGAGEVVVRVRGVGICGSDLALLAGHRQPPQLPWVPGHEATGEVISTGDGVDPGRAGQRVVIEPNIPCFACPACAAGRTSACPRRIVLGFSAPGMLAERVAVPAGFAWPVPADWTDEDAVCSEPLAVAQAAIGRAGGPPAGRCLVIGAGSQGALLCVALAGQGVQPYVLEPHPGRLELARELGARLATAEDLDFGLVFETSGAPAALAEAARRTAPAGTVIMIGMSGQPLPLTTRDLVTRQLTLRGSLIYDHPGDFAATMRSPVRSLRPGRVLRARYPLAEARAAFESAREVPGKTWIQVSH
jgi:alcohol dehydrogenase/L-iditol 2-dehydrogenase